MLQVMSRFSVNRNFTLLCEKGCQAFLTMPQKINVPSWLVKAVFTFPRAHYHFMLHGHSGQSIFYCDEDRKHFKNLVAEVVIYRSTTVCIRPFIGA